MAIKRLNQDEKFASRDRSLASVSTLPTVKAMVDCFERYLNLTIADGHASSDTVKTYHNRVHQFLSWCRGRERSAFAQRVHSDSPSFRGQGAEGRAHDAEASKVVRRTDTGLYKPLRAFARD